MKAPIYLHKPDGGIVEISIQEGIEIVNRAVNKGHYIENVRRDYGGDVAVYADFQLIKFPAHYADALDILEAASPTPREWYIEHGYLPPFPTHEDHMALSMREIQANIEYSLQHIDSAIEEYGKYDELAGVSSADKVKDLERIKEMLQSVLR
jgi:hypothetical protein